MKQLLIILALAALIACQPAAETPKQPVSSEPTTITDDTNITFADVLNEFDALDKELNHSWKQENIPYNMIPPEHVEPWTARVVKLKDKLKTQNNPRALNLVNARIAMLESQLAYYLMATTENSNVEVAKEGKNYIVTEPINCEHVPNIIKAINLNSKAAEAQLEFMTHMDNVLQGSQEAKERLGANENRLAFYTHPFANLNDYIKAVEDAIIVNCAGKSVDPQSA